MTTTSPAANVPPTKGLVVHWAARYDILVWFVTLGRERAFREKLLAPAKLRSGESVLDVGCGTGSLALAAARQVGPSGSVQGVDASPEMIGRARHKARKTGANVTFDQALAESLPFPDARFDVVTSTLMLHHLPRKIRERGVAEMARVLKPGGRLLAVDFAQGSAHGLMHLLPFHKHGHVKPDQLLELTQGAGLQTIETGPAGAWDIQYVLAAAPRAR